MGRILVAFASIAVLAVPVFAADVSGAWTVRLLTAGGNEAPTVDVVLKQEGEKLSGSCSLQELDDDLTISGQITGDGVSWQCSSPEVRMTFTGAIGKTGEIAGSWTTGKAEGTFAATKR